VTSSPPPSNRERLPDGRFPPSGGTSKGPARGAPASGYSRPPFPPGHLLTLAHGARSPRFVDPTAAELAEALLEDRPDLMAYPEALSAWARAEARVLLYEQFHARVGLLDEDGRIRGGEHVNAVEKQAQRMRERLGLDPRSEAELASARATAVHLVADLEAIRARGRAAIEQRRQELGVTTTDTTPALGSRASSAVDDYTREARYDARNAAEPDITSPDGRDSTPDITPSETP
jgi:hypothetical protein